MKLFMACFFSMSLILTSLSAYASDENGAKELPSFYFVEEIDNGQTFRIATCYKKTLTNAGTHCPTKTDVNRDDLNQFLAEVNSDIGASYWHHTFAIFGAGGLVLGGLGSIYAGVNTLVNKAFTGKKIAFVVSATLVAGAGHAVAEKYLEGFTIHIDSIDLRDQINSGVIEGRYSRGGTRRIFERFETFLQKYGHTVTAETENSTAVYAP